MSVITGLQLPFGIQPVNPAPVDSWSGPFSAVDVATAVSDANSAIPAAIRFQSMEVRLIVNGVSRKFWYRDGIDDSDLVEFVAGGGGSGSTDPGGSNTHVQFNDGGYFGGNTNFVFNKNTSTLTVTNVSGSLTTLSDGSPYLVAGQNISITTGSNGQITISSTIDPSPPTPPVQNTDIAWMETPSGDIDGINMVFELSASPVPVTSLMFFVNGVLQKQGNSYDYTLTDNTVALLNAPNQGSNLTATYTYQPASTPGKYVSWAETPVGDIDGANVVFTLQHSPYPLSGLMFYVNGILQIQGENYDFLASSNTVILKTAPVEGSNLSATYPY
jgi:hypothetical protein